MVAKSKSMRGKDGDRNLAAGAGRASHKSGGEPKKPTSTAAISNRAKPGRSGSSKQRKG
jgi:hypothetical protein